MIRSILKLCNFIADIKVYGSYSTALYSNLQLEITMLHSFVHCISMATEHETSLGVEYILAESNAVVLGTGG